MKIQISKDKQKAKMLINMADITIKRLQEINNNKYPSNTLTDYYDIIHKILEAITLSEGIKIKGEGAHKKLIDYVAKKHNLKTSEKIFIQELREFRNRIAYEGFIVTSDYFLINNEKIKKIIKKTKDIYSKVSKENI